MRLNWGPFLWMRCYNNGAQFLDRVVGPNPNWESLEAATGHVPPGCRGTSVLPFALSEPSRNVSEPRVEWTPSEPGDPGVRYLASLEALAYLIALGVREHEQAGQRVSRISISGGIARSELMGEILATVLNRPLERLVSNEGPALGAAATALAALESHRQHKDSEPYPVAEAVARMVKFRQPVKPRADWLQAYATGLSEFERRLVNPRP
jgi:sugar (pentulose or hexulose) kinase